MCSVVLIYGAHHRGKPGVTDRRTETEEGGNRGEVDNTMSFTNLFNRRDKSARVHLVRSNLTILGGLFRLGPSWDLLGDHERPTVILSICPVVSPNFTPSQSQWSKTAVTTEKRLGQHSTPSPDSKP
jgi:hypothetical protein